MVEVSRLGYLANSIPFMVSFRIQKGSISIHRFGEHVTSTWHQFTDQMLSLHFRGYFDTLIRFIHMAAEKIRREETFAVPTPSPLQYRLNVLGNLYE